MSGRFDHLNDHDKLTIILERIASLKDGDHGDIPEIKDNLRELNHKLVDHESRISKIEGKNKIILMLLGGIIGGGGIIGLLIKIAGG